MPLENLDTPSYTYLPYKLPYSLGDLAAENLFAILDDPHKMVFQIVGCMARFAATLHTIGILKSSPKGEGFSPIPRRGHQSLVVHLDGSAI